MLVASSSVIDCVTFQSCALIKHIIVIQSYSSQPMHSLSFKLNPREEKGRAAIDSNPHRKRRCRSRVPMFSTDGRIIDDNRQRLVRVSPSVNVRQSICRDDLLKNLTSISLSLFLTADIYIPQEKTWDQISSFIPARERASQVFCSLAREKSFCFLLFTTDNIHTWLLMILCSVSF